MARRQYWITEADADEMERLWLSGHGTPAIAKRFGCSAYSVRHRLVKRGHPLRHKDRTPRRKWYRCQGGVSVHRLVAEQMLGRKLLPGECVHHKNGDPHDNRPENLEVFPSHSAHMATGHSPWNSEKDAMLWTLRLARVPMKRVAAILGTTWQSAASRMFDLKRRGGPGALKDVS